MQRAFDFNDRIAKDVMVDRTSLYVVDITDTVKDVLKDYLQQGFSRFPVVAENDKDKILGYVYAYDLDEVAVAAAKENMDLNPIAADVHVSANDLLKGIDHSADVIVANILADIIVLMIEDAWRLLKQDGTFIISGIIEDKKAMVLEALTKVGFVVDQLFNQGDWYAIILKKPEEE